jgi:pyruvyl transferase EpsO
MGIDNVLLDNNYRKLGAVFDAYTGRFTTGAYAHDDTEALALAQAALSRDERG